MGERKKVEEDGPRKPPRRILSGVANAVFAPAPSRDVLYTRPDPTNPLRALTALRWSAENGGETQLLVERNPRYFLDVGLSKDGGLATLNSNSKRSSEVHLVLPGHGEDHCAPVLVHPHSNFSYFVEVGLRGQPLLSNHQ